MKHFGAVAALVIACVFVWSGLTVADGPDRRGDGSRDVERPGRPPAYGRKEGLGPSRSRPSGLRGPRRPTTQPHRRGLSEAQEKELLAVLKDKRPELYKRLIDMKGKDTNRPSYRWTLQMMWRWYERWKHLPKEIQDAAIAEMDSKIEGYRLAREMQKVDSVGEKEQIMTKLRGVVGKQFDAEQTVRGYRLTQLAKQLERAREELQARAKRRAEIIDELVERLVKMGSRVTKRPWKDQPTHARKPKAERDEPHRRPPAGKGDKAGT